MKYNEKRVKPLNTLNFSANGKIVKMSKLPELYWIS